MNSNFRYIFIIISIILLFIFGWEFILRQIPNDYNYKSNYIKENGSKIETLILGSSHTFTGLNPNKFKSNTFNAAYSSQTLNLDYEIFEKNKKHLTNLKTIIIPISYFTFTSQLDDFAEKKIKFYNIYWNIQTGYSDLNKNFELVAEPIDVNYTKIINYIKLRNYNITIDGKGYIKQRFEPKWNDEENSLKAFKRHRANMGTQKVRNVIKTHYHLLENIIKYTKEHNISVVLLTTPTTDLYKDYVIKTPQYFNLKQNVEKLSNNENVLFIDYFINNKDFKLKDFKDSDHLSADGANKFSIKVDSILLHNSIH